MLEKHEAALSELGPDVSADDSTPGRRSWTPDAYAMQVERHAREWLDLFALAPDAGTRARIEKIHAGAAFATLFPRGRAEIHELAADIMVWITAVGDVLVDRGRPDFARFVLSLAEALNGIPGGDGQGVGFSAALADILARSRRHLTPRHHLRAVNALTAFIMAQNWHVSADTGAIVPSVADYVAARRHTVGGWTLVALIEPLENFRFAAHVGDDPRVQDLNIALCDVLAWVNDLASHRKERRAATSMITLPALVARERGCALPESFEIVSRMRDAEAARAEEIADRLRRDGGDLCDYAGVCTELIGYFSLWHTVLAADRYQ